MCRCGRGASELSEFDLSTYGAVSKGYLYKCSHLLLQQLGAGHSSSAQVPVLLTRELSGSGYEEEEERVVGNHAGKRSPFTV